MCTPFRATHKSGPLSPSEQVLVVGFVMAALHPNAPSAIFIHTQFGAGTLGYGQLYEFSDCEVVPTLQFPSPGT